MKKLIFTLLCALLLFVACRNSSSSSSQAASSQQNGETQAQTLTGSAKTVLDLLSRKDFEALADWIHPELGLRFSPYGFVDTSSDLRFSRAEFKAMLANEAVRVWGAYDGSGEPIEITFRDYYKEFIFNADFSKPEKFAENEIIGKGNTLINMAEMYPDCEFTESYFSGFVPEFAGMDWSSLRLVFKKEGARYYLVGIVHDQWTT